MKFKKPEEYISLKEAIELISMENGCLYRDAVDIMEKTSIFLTLDDYRLGGYRDHTYLMKEKFDQREKLKRVEEYINEFFNDPPVLTNAESYGWIRCEFLQFMVGKEVLLKKENIGVANKSQTDTENVFESESDKAVMLEQLRSPDNISPIINDDFGWIAEYSARSKNFKLLLDATKEFCHSLPLNSNAEIKDVQKKFEDFADTRGVQNLKGRKAQELASFLFPPDCK